MVLSTSLGVLLGTAVFGAFLLYMLFNLSKDKQVKKDGAFEIIEEVTQHKWLQLILIGLFFLNVMIMGFSVQDMGSRACEYLPQNETISGNVTTYAYDYECTVVDNAGANNFFRLVIWGVRMLLMYITIYFLVQVYKAARAARDANNRRQGR